MAYSPAAAEDYETRNEAKVGVHRWCAHPWTSGPALQLLLQPGDLRVTEARTAGRTLQGHSSLATLTGGVAWWWSDGVDHPPYCGFDGALSGG